MVKREVERDKNVVIVEYEFEPQEVKKAEEKAARYLNQRIVIPGFRKGKVPLNVLRVRLGEDFDEYVFDYLIEEAVKDEKTDKLLMAPIVIETERQGEKVLVKVEYHYEPEVKIDNYENIDLKVVDKEEVLKKFVDTSLEGLREEHALVEPKEGEAGYGDMVKVRMIVTTDEGKVLRDEEYEYVLVDDDDRPFVTELVGKKKGDVVEFDKEYEGKKFHYKIEILEVYNRTLMELDDEFAKAVGSEFETLEQLKEHLKEQGSEIYDRETKESLREQAFDWLVDNVELEISEKTLERFVERAVEKLKEKGKYEEYVERYGGEDKLKESFRGYYLRQLKEDYVINKIAELEGIEITDEDIEKEAAELSKIWGISEERAKVLVKKKPDMYAELKWVLLKRRALDAVVDKAKITTLSEEEYRKVMGGEVENGDTGGDEKGNENG